jgi:hypothetical protein
MRSTTTMSTLPSTTSSSSSLTTLRRRRSARRGREIFVIVSGGRIFNTTQKRGRREQVTNLFIGSRRRLGQQRGFKETFQQALRKSEQEDDNNNKTSNNKKKQDENAIDYIKSLVSGSYYEEDEDNEIMSFEIGNNDVLDGMSTQTSSESSSLAIKRNRRKREKGGVQFFKPGLRRLTARQRMALAFSDLDSSGWWAVISSGIVFGTFILESYNIGTFGGWDVLYRSDIPWYSGLVSMDNIRDIEDAYNALFFFEFLLRAWVADFKFSFWTNPFTVLDTAATIPPILSAFGLVDRMSPLPRFLRLLRVIRLLRFLERSPDSVLFGLFKSDSMTVQLTGVAAEFICIFVIAAGVIYDLEYGINPAVKNLNDTLYWAVLTLTGIGQPFEVVTAGGRIATVVSIFVALLVIPGQLAKLATISGGEMLLGMMEEEDEDEDTLVSNTGEVFILKSTDEDPITGGVGGGGAKTFDDRVCDSCGLEFHEIDARYCRRCSFKLAESEATGMRFSRRMAKKKKSIDDKKNVPLNVGRLGIDMMSSISTSTKVMRGRKQ